MTEQDPACAAEAAARSSSITTTSSLARRLSSQEHSIVEKASADFSSWSIQHKEALALKEFLEQLHNKDHLLKRLRFHHCKFDVRQERTMGALVRLFNSPALSSLESLELHTPTLSNERVAQMLQGVRDSLQELTFEWSFARAATQDRHLVFQQLGRLRKLTLVFAGMEMFAEMDGDFARVLPQMTDLQELGLHGWTIRGVRLREVIDSIQQIPTLRSLTLHDTKGSGPVSLTEFGRLEDLRTLRLSRCQSLFQGATEEQINAFLRATRVETLELRCCGFPRPLTRACLRYIGEPEVCRPSAFSLEETSFGAQECELLAGILPKTALTSLEIQVPGAGGNIERRDLILKALRQNTSLESFGLEPFGLRLGSGHATNGFTREIQRILERNKRAHFVDRFLLGVPIISSDALQLLVFALARLLADNEGSSDVQRLVSNRSVWLAGCGQQSQPRTNPN